MTVIDDQAEYMRRVQVSVDKHLAIGRQRIGWILDGNYAEPSDELKPFVLALLKSAIIGEDNEVDRALEALRKLFPPRMQ